MTIVDSSFLDLYRSGHAADRRQGVDRLLDHGRGGQKSMDRGVESFKFLVHKYWISQALSRLSEEGDFALLVVSAS